MVELVTPTTPGPPLLVGVVQGVPIKLPVPPPPTDERDCRSTKSAVVVAAEETAMIGDVVITSPE